MMKRKRIIICLFILCFILINIRINVLVYNKGLENGQVSYQKELVQENSVDTKEETEERQESDRAHVEWKNSYYELFYGEWEATEKIYIDPIPVRGAPYEDIEEAKKYYIENLEVEKIQFTPDKMIINENDVREDLQYDITVFPARDNYYLHFTMTLEDIGLTEEQGKYYAYVEVKEMVSGGKFIRFFIKDENTIILYYRTYCVEYTRTSYEGGSQEPVIISG